MKIDLSIHFVRCSIMLPKIIFILFTNVFILYSSLSHAWETTPQLYAVKSHWRTEIIGDFDISLFKYKNDGKSVVRYSLTPPFEDSKAGSQIVMNKWNTMDGEVVVRFTGGGITADGYTGITPQFGGVTRNDKNKMYTGTIYMWYGKQAMATFNYTMWYDPFISISAPTGVIDLGTCHKVNQGNILSKDVSMVVNVYGYTASSKVSVTRSFNFNTLPNGAMFTNQTGQVISSGKIENISSINTSPNSANDTFTAKFKCDAAEVGVHSWNTVITYTVQ